MRTKRFQSTFYPDCLSEREKLNPEFRESRSVIIFKKQLLGRIRPPSKSVYGIHGSKRLSILTQLRVGLSKLNFRKFKHNFRDTLNPLCLINDGVEDTEHFLLLCRAYDIHRRDLLDSVNAMLRPRGLSNPLNKQLLQILLSGHEKLPFHSNTHILEAILNYTQTKNGSNKLLIFLCKPLSYKFICKILFLSDQSGVAHHASALTWPISKKLYCQFGFSL